MIYVNQSYLRFAVNTGVSLTTAVTELIKYRKPSGATGEWVVDSISGHTLVYNVQVGDLDEAGIWKLQAEVTFDDGRVALGTIASVTVKEGL
jgi:hypothetical protein